MHFKCFNFLYDPPQPVSISINLLQRIAFWYSFVINIVYMRHPTCFDTIHPLIYHRCTALKPILCILCHITSYTTPSALSISIKLHQRLAFSCSFEQNVNMRHTTCFDTIKLLIYQLYTAVKPILDILCHITYHTTLSLSISIKLHQHIAFRYSVKINIVKVRHMTCFDTAQALIYHLCKVLKPMLCI